MVEIARTLQETDPADIRAMSDHGIALLRLGIVSAGPEKRATLEKAHGMLEHAARRSPKDMPTGRHKSWTEVELGDVLLAAGDRASATRYYRMAMATSEALQSIDLVDSASLRWRSSPRENSLRNRFAWVIGPALCLR